MIREAVFSHFERFRASSKGNIVMGHLSSKAKAVVINLTGQRKQNSAFSFQNIFLRQHWWSSWSVGRLLHSNNFSVWTCTVHVSPACKNCLNAFTSLSTSFWNCYVIPASSHLGSTSNISCGCNRQNCESCKCLAYCVAEIWGSDSGVIHNCVITVICSYYNLANNQSDCLIWAILFVKQCKYTWSFDGRQFSQSVWDLEIWPRGARWIQRSELTDQPYLNLYNHDATSTVKSSFKLGRNMFYRVGRFRGERGRERPLVMQNPLGKWQAIHVQSGNWSVSELIH